MAHAEREKAIEQWKGNNALLWRWPKNIWLWDTDSAAKAIFFLKADIFDDKCDDENDIDR
jgi:hypothetical protein